MRATEDRPLRIGDVLPLPGASSEGLPPGQRAIRTFVRFGAHFSAPIPRVPADFVIAIGGEVENEVALPLRRLRELGRRNVVTDFHCVAGWSVRAIDSCPHGSSGRSTEG